MKDFLVVGGGIVGLAAARALLARRPGASVVVLERGDDLATDQTGHNSGVIHTGLYYTPGSLKARLCRAGEAATKLFCDEHGIRYETNGKLVVATDELDLDRMGRLAERAAQNGIQLERLDERALREREPHVRGVGALFSPATGIVNYREVALAMAEDIRRAGGQLITRSTVRRIEERATSDDVLVEADTGTYRCRRLIACAGLQADRVAAMAGLEPDFQVVPFRGEYYQLRHERAGLVRHLIYPVPDPGLPFLGVHITPMIDGRTTVGPNAVLSFSRERYERGAVTARDALRWGSYPGFWRFARHNVRAGLAEMRDSYFIRRYLARVQRYCPDIQLDDLRPYPAGIRAQAIMRDGTLVDDFLIRSTERQVHICNAPSPAATSAIPIGETIASRVLGEHAATEVGM